MNKLKEKRIEKCYTQKELAEKAGIPLRTYQNYESRYDTILNITPKNVEKIVKVLGCDVKDLL